MEKIDFKLSAFEKQIGRFPFSLLVGLLSILVAMLVVAPKFFAQYHGLFFSMLSNDPLDFRYPNPLQYRILPSLIGYLVQLRGGKFMILPLLFAWGFISSIYWVYRRKGFGIWEAIAMSALIAFSCTLYITLISPGYTDAVFYFFIFLAFSTVKRPIWSAAFFGLAMLSHESSLFMLPPLILYSAYVNQAQKGKIITHFVALVLALVPLLVYRALVSRFVHVEYGLDFYLSTENLVHVRESVTPRLPLGLFFVFKLFWVIPLFVLWKLLRAKEFLLASVILCILVCDIAQLLIAYDVTRMLCLGFPLMLISAEKLREYLPENRFAKAMLVLVLLNFLVPQYFMTAEHLVWMRPFFL